MPEIIPFRGWRYDPRIVGSLAKVLAPPYDVISDELRDALYRRSPYNFVRLDLKKDSEGDVYRKAAEDLRRWIGTGVFRRDGSPSLYIYAQDYRRSDGRPARRVGFISLMKIDPAKVKKHEHTLAGPKADRMKLTERLGAQLSPIFGIFADRTGAARAEIRRTFRREPAVDVTLDGVRHRLYVEDDPALIARLGRALRAKPMYIADGHHRFEVAHQYSLRHDQPYVLTYLCPAEGNDLTIYPTHRVLSLPKGWDAGFRRIVAREFREERARSLPALLSFLDRESRRAPVMGCAVRNGSGLRFFGLRPKGRVREPDVMLAGRKLIGPLLGEDVARSRRIRYTRDAREAEGLVKTGRADLAVFLAKLPIREVMRVSDRGMHLPQKSTYFYPKLLSGLVFYQF